MSGMPAVIVKKGGFLTAFFQGLFGLAIVCVVCVSGLGFFALSRADRTIQTVLMTAGGIVEGLPQWVEKLPPMISDGLNDRRAPDYRQNLEVTVRSEKSPRDAGRNLSVVTVKNTGVETVSVLALNIVYENDDGVPVGERRVYAATPILIDEDDWRGPLFPDSTRRFVVSLFGHDTDLRPAYEIAELRVWNGPRDAAPAELAHVDEDLES